MTEQNQSRNVETPLSTTMIASVVLSRSNHSQTTSRVHYKLTGWTTTSLCWSSRFMTSSKPSRVNSGWSVWKRSHAIRLILEWDYCSLYDCKRHQTSQCWSLCKYLEDLVRQEYLREYVLIPGFLRGRKTIGDPVSGSTTTHGHSVPSD